MPKSALAIAFVLLLLVFSVLFYLRQSKNQEMETVTLTSEEAAPVPAAPPAIQYPLPPAAGEVEETPLPPLNDSDPALQKQIGELYHDPALRQLFLSDQLIRRIVVTVDNLPRKILPPQYLPLQRPAGAFLAKGEGEGLTVDPRGYRRYTPFVQLVEAADTGRVVAAYIRFYPLFQKAYEELGYPERYFNDRLVEVLDHLLATPQVKEPVRLVPTTLGFHYADPALESLSAGQKLLLRMGTENAARIQEKLRNLRREVAGAMQKS